MYGKSLFKAGSPYNIVNGFERCGWFDLQFDAKRFASYGNTSISTATPGMTALERLSVAMDYFGNSMVKLVKETHIDLEAAAAKSRKKRVKEGDDSAKHGNLTTIKNLHILKTSWMKQCKRRRTIVEKTESEVLKRDLALRSAKLAEVQMKINKKEVAAGKRTMFSNMSFEERRKWDRDKRIKSNLLRKEKQQQLRFAIVSEIKNENDLEPSLPSFSFPSIKIENVDIVSVIDVEPRIDVVSSDMLPQYWVLPHKQQQIVSNILLRTVQKCSNPIVGAKEQFAEGDLLPALRLISNQDIARLRKKKMVIRYPVDGVSPINNNSNIL